MKLLKRILVGAAVAILPATMAVKPAEAIGWPYWNNTYNASSSNYYLTVGWCSGGTGKIAIRKKVTRNVCSIRVQHGRNLYVKTSTGAVLIPPTNNCGSAFWWRFTTRTDTSLTAIVRYKRIYCA